MQKNPLLQFIEEKLHEKPRVEAPGPVITVSREFGCPGNELGEEIVKILSARREVPETENNGVVPWKSLGREIMAEAAEKINLTPELVEKLAGQKHTHLFSDFFSTFSDHYVPGDLEVKKAVANVIRALAHQGRVILVGRGAVSLTQHVESSIHVFVYAPQKWRIKQVMDRFQISHEEAIRRIEQVDYERNYIRNFYAGKTTDISFYDIAFNAESISTEEMAHTVIRLMEKKRFVAG